MVRTQAGHPLQVRDGPRDFEHPIVCPGRKGQAGHCLAKNPGGGIVQPGQIVEGFAGGREAFLDPAQRLRGLSTPFLKFSSVLLFQKNRPFMYSVRAATFSVPRFPIVS